VRSPWRLRSCGLRWLYYGLKYLDLTRFNKAAAIPGLNREDAYELKLRVPTMAEQDAIVACLDRATDLINARRYALQVCDEFLPASFLQIVGDPRTNPRKLPRANIEELGKVETGNTPPRERKEYYGAHVEWIKSDNITLAEMHPTRAAEYLSATGAEVGRIVEVGSLLVTCIAGSLASIGNVVVTNRRVAFNQQINSITPHDDVDPLFLYALMLVAKPIVQAGSTEAMKKMITKSKLEELVLFKPRMEEQRKFAKIVTHWAAVRRANREALRQADHLFQTLLHEAFN
jgi:type I restriction enzyme S subunit